MHFMHSDATNGATVLLTTLKRC